MSELEMIVDCKTIDDFVDCKTIDDLKDDELKFMYSYDFIPFKEFPKPKYPDDF